MCVVHVHLPNESEATKKFIKFARKCNKRHFFSNKHTHTHVQRGRAPEIEAISLLICNFIIIWATIIWNMITHVIKEQIISSITTPRLFNSCCFAIERDDYTSQNCSYSNTKEGLGIYLIKLLTFETLFCWCLRSFEENKCFLGIDISLTLLNRYYFTENTQTFYCNVSCLSAAVYIASVVVNVMKLN